MLHRKCLGHCYLVTLVHRLEGNFALSTLAGRMSCIRKGVLVTTGNHVPSPAGTNSGCHATHFVVAAVVAISFE
jgi:hypothetical protein